MGSIDYIGLDVHKRTISYCAKDVSGEVLDQGKIRATKEALRGWAEAREREWIGGMEATMFTGWIYDELRPYAKALKVAHPQMVEAIVVGKKKNDRVDASMLADLLRCSLLPECYMLPAELRHLRRVLRFRNLLVALAVKMRNRIAGILMEVGAEYESGRLHGRAYFQDLLGTLEDVPESAIEILQLSRETLEFVERMQKQLVRGLREDPELSERVGRLMTIPGVGQITALTWALEIGDPERFSSIRKAVSYCGLCSDEKESAGKRRRGPLSKKRNAHLQTVLIEAGKLAPRHNPQLKAIYDGQKEKGADWNQATVAVARKLVSYLLAVDKRQTDFVPQPLPAAAG